MRYILLTFLLTIGCSKQPSDIKTSEVKPSVSSAQLNNSIPENSQSLEVTGEFEIFLGIHNVEYFADRMVLKSKIAGYDFATKTYVGTENGRKIYKVVLGPFKTLSAAEEAEKQIKILTPDLTISRINKVK